MTHFKTMLRFFLLFSLLFLSVEAMWAQSARPTEITIQNDDACVGTATLKVKVGEDFTSDDEWMRSGSLYLVDSDGRREILYISGTDYDEVSSSLRGNSPSTGKVTSTEITGVDERFMIIHVGNLSNRDEEDISFELDFEWEIDDFGSNTIEDAFIESKDILKKAFINTIFTAAQRDNCNPTKIEVKATVSAACKEDGFKYRLNIQRAEDEAFTTNVVTLVSDKDLTPESANANIVEVFDDITPDIGTYYYRSTVEYRETASSLVYQTESSSVTKPQDFNVNPPTLKSVSEDICENTINISWEYNINEANNFSLYRSSSSINTLDLDGENDCLTISNTSTMFSDNSSASLEALIKLEKIENANIFYNSGNFDIYSNDQGKLIADAAGGTVTSQDALPLNTWIHVAIVIDANNALKIYFNGSLQAETATTGSINSTTLPLYIGCFGIGSFSFKGEIADVRVWNEALSSINHNSPVDINANGLILHYDFSEGIPMGDNQSISTIEDRTNNSFDATLDNFTLTGDTSNFGSTYAYYEFIKNINGQTLSYEDSRNIVSNRKYNYYVTATKTCDGNTNESVPSNNLIGFSPTKPLTPTNLSVMVSEEDNTITLDWTDNAFDETEYEIQRRFGDASNTFSVAADDTMYVDEALLACRGYEYDVYAKNVCGLSNESAQTSARLEPNLSAVLSSNAVEASKGRFMNRVELTWTPQNNAGNIIDRYRVYRKVLGNTDSVQIDVVSGNANIYRDETADAGILYEYTLVGETDCDGDVLQSNVISTVGYRTATALVSGQVTYTGGNAVEGVKVLVAPADGTQVGKSLVLDGTDDKVTFDSLDLNSSFTIEFWSKRANNNANILFSHGDTTSTASQNLQLGYDAGGSFYMEFGAEVLSSNTSYNDTDWHHWTCVYDAASNERLIYHNDSLLIKDNPSGAYTTQGIYQLGSAVSGAAFFNGQFDEMRIWKTARDSAEIVRDYNRILNNDDANLLAMYSFDEGIGVEVYDRSKIGITYNSRHGKMMGVNSLNEAWSMVIPTPDQLGLYGITDANGNYIVAAIPYSGTGSAFKVVPQFGTHQFEPSQTNLFIGQGSDIFNGTNFNDISSFPVTGTVFYQGTSCPADQIEIQIDGVTAILNGNKVMTTSDGAFTVDVPIGRHRVSLYKEGHEFAVGQFPTNGSLFDFQEPISGLEFIDSTRLKVIGRVVGGTREGDKVPGLGRSVNNIGKARVVYEALVGNGCHQDTVFTDSQTGEYVTYLYPLKYVVKDVRVSNPMQNISTSDFFDALPQINLVNIGDETTARDSVFTAGTTNLERVDSIKYNYRQDFIYRNTAEIAVLMEDQSSKFGGQEAYSTEYNGGTFEVNTLKSDSGVYPVFERGKEYRAYISATENYENFDNDAPIVEDKVPITDGQLIINNQMASDNKQMINIGLSDGDTIYTFIAGRPNLLVDNNNPEFSYTKTMDITLQRPGQVEDVKWEPNSGTTAAERVFRAYLLGQMDIIGSNFVTKGPDIPRFVLRDPPGDNSSASYTVETAWNLSEKLSLGYGFSKGFNAEVKVGAKTEVGIGTSTEIEAAETIGNNFTVNYGVTAAGEFSQTWTSSESFSTNDGEEAVGTRSDLYVGEQFNIIFGMVNILELLPRELCNSTTLDCYDIDPSLDYLIGIRKGFRVSPGKNKTTFIYDQNYIVNYLIPNLKNIRNSLFINQPDRYQSMLSSDDENYGRNNDDPVWGMAVFDPMKQAIKDTLEFVYGSANEIPKAHLATTFINNPYVSDQSDSTGMSYRWIRRNATEPYGMKTDSVRFYNQQIRLWEEAIYENEKDKIRAFNNPSEYLDKNISLNGGVGFSSESAFGYSAGASLATEFSVSNDFMTKFESEVAGTGSEFTTSLSHTFTVNAELGFSREKTTTWAYEIKDVDQGDVHNIEIYESPRGWGPIFKTIAGQTSCPHEEGNETLFYEAGTKLNERTLQRDKIEIGIFPSIVQNVPEGEAAVFNIQLQNTSETNDSRSYAIRVDPTSNPDGLSVNMDGETITVENEFALPGGSVQTKVITVERGPEKYEYNDIRLLVYAPCQYQAGTSDEIDIVDTVTFSVTFLPECTDIRLKEPNDLWVLNNFNQDTLPITIDNYDINKNGFESISLQYKPASESVWRELNKWWHPTNTTEIGDQIPTNSSFIRYDWDMSSNTDGPYQLRVVSGCELVNKETEFKQGHADRINPHPFGTPSPQDGICDPGEDLQIRFNENIDIGSLTSLNFDIRGVLNGTELRHSESVAFDGNNDYMAIPAYDLTKRSLSVEFWAKLNATGGGTVFSQGSTLSEGLFVGFDASNRFQFLLAGNSITADNATAIGEWKHFVASYDYEAKTVALLIDGVEVKVSSTFTEDYVSTGDIRVGQQIADGGNYLNANIHELRLWSKTRSTIDVVPTFNVSLSPTTAGLIGYWPMNEGIGSLVEDKVRKRNGVLSGTTWTILPLGQAFSFNGTSDYLEVNNAGTIVFTEETDMTLEMWFKGTSAGTLFSNGKGDGSDSETSWTISLDASGKVVVNNNGQSFESNASGYLDNNWHHIAIVLQRNSAINLYIDGALTKTASSNDWKGFASAKYWIGTRGWIAGVTENRDQYFNGSIDEVRVWNLARRVEQIERDYTSRLLGDELGLIAYYPFEAYVLDAGVPVLNQSILDESENDYDLSLGGSTALNYVQPTPPIKLQRPVQKVNFTYSINQDEIILTPTDPSARLEHVTLDITVRNVQDNYGNVMQSPATWIAFINKNQVVWDREELEVAQNFGESGTFEAFIVNTGGSQKAFDVLNLPSWLTASPASGSIAPNSTKKVTFTIAEGVNIGSYEQDILLSTDFGFNERLVLNLKVAATAPDWAINTNMFQHSMSYVGQLLIEGIISTDTEDRLAAFVGEELRGVANVELDPLTDKYLVFLDVYSNEVTGEALEFRIWNASEGKIHLPVTPTDHTFLLHEFVGTPETPQIFEAVSSIGQAYSLEAGWNWISFPLSSATLSSVDETLADLDATESDRVLSQFYFDTYSEIDGWSGSLTFVGNGFNRKEGYKLYVANPGTFSYSGTLGDPSSESLALNVGWNWIGVIAEQNLDINVALATLNPADGDVIKGQRTFAVYEEGIGWTGSLDYLEPTKGYMIKLSNAGTLTYPVGNGLAPAEAALKANNQLLALEASMNLQPNDFKESMSMVVSVQTCSNFSIGQTAYLAAYVNGENRGIAPIEWQGKRAIAYLTLHGNAREEFEFRLIKSKQSQQFDLQERIAFQADALIGQTFEPFIFHLLENCLTATDNEWNTTKAIPEISIYPNPFEEQLNIEFKLPESERIQVVLQDLNGRIVAEIFDGVLEAGSHNLLWQESYRNQLSSGVYFLNIQSDSIHHVEKVIR